MTITVKFIGALRHFSHKTEVTIDYQKGASIKDIATQLTQEFPKLKNNLIGNEFSEPQSNSLILINGTEISVLNGYETKLNDGDEVVFVPVVHGG
ncbi:MAG: MoaD/ThiS family protein [Candidatus Bathyarchaeota archaeon]|nr:MoaD/ThiS family protein [Candidatus Bathyarchaeota archaeon]